MKWEVATYIEICWNLLKYENHIHMISYEYLLQKQSQERHDGTIASEQKSLRFRLTGRCRAAERENIWLSILGPQKVQHWNCFECCSPERLWQGQVLETAVTIRGECHPQCCLKWVSLVGDNILRTLETLHYCAAQTPHLLHEIQGSDPLPPCAHGVIAVGACKSCLRLSFRCSRYFSGLSHKHLLQHCSSNLRQESRIYAEHLWVPCYGIVQSCHV